MDLCVQGSLGHLQEEVSGDFFGKFEFFKESKNLILGHFHAFDEDSWMNSIADVSLGLTHQLSNEKNIGSGSITDHVILGGGSSANHSRSWVLDLHFVQQDCTILGELDLSSSTDEHLDSTLWTKVSFKNLLKTLGSIDVDSESLRFSNNVSVCVDELK